MDPFQYLLLMGVCLLLTLPLEALGEPVYRRPLRLVRTLLPLLGVFLVWDAVAIAREHWTFNPLFTTGWLLPLRIPVEELVFFVAIPLCALLTYGAFNRLLPSRER